LSNNGGNNAKLETDLSAIPAAIECYEIYERVPIGSNYNNLLNYPMVSETHSLTTTKCSKE